MRPLVIAVVCLLVIPASSVVVALSSAHLESVKSEGPSPSLAFTRNMGQWPDSVLFRASGGSTTLWIMRDGIYYQFSRIAPPTTEPEAQTTSAEIPFISNFGKHGRGQEKVEIAMIKAEFLGAGPSVVATGQDELDYRCNFFLGDDKSKWRTEVPNYAGVKMNGLYPGVDITFHGQGGELVYELQGADASIAQVRVGYEGALSEREVDGTTYLTTSVGEEAFRGILLVRNDAREGFAMAAADVSSGNISLSYSTYLGGSLLDGAAPDYGGAIAVDAEGAAYVTGSTTSIDFPTLYPYQTDRAGYDAYVTKVAPSGNSLVYSTYLGGNDYDYSYDIAVDLQGSAYVTGYTRSTDYPTQNPFQANQGDIDAFVTKLAADGSTLVFSTYLGGSSWDGGYSIVVDTSYAAYVTGHTASADFPKLNSYQTFQFAFDVFVTKFAPSGGSLSYSSNVGGNDHDYGLDIAVDKLGAAYVSGVTSSTNFPTVNWIQTNQLDWDAYVFKLTPTGNTLSYSTYLGGGAIDWGSGIAVDTFGQVCITGVTTSTDYPTSGAYQPDQPGDDVFLSKLSPSGNTFVYSTYLGGEGWEGCNDIAVNLAGEVYLTGQTGSAAFPTKFPYQTDQPNVNAFVTKFAVNGSELVYSTYLGGGLDDRGWGVAVDAYGNAYINGVTSSTNFPCINAFDNQLNGANDAFVTKLSGLCCFGVTGDVNMKGIVDLADLSALVSYLTGGGYLLPCPDEANVNSVGIVDLSDLSALVSYLTGGGYSLPNCL